MFYTKREMMGSHMGRMVDNGGIRAMPYSMEQKQALLVETAKANGLDPYDYLLYALSVLPYWGKSTSHEMLETAMPWSRDVQQRIGKEVQTESE